MTGTVPKIPQKQQVYEVIVFFVHDDNEEKLLQAL